jgi:hypothetical protein
MGNNPVSMVDPDGGYINQSSAGQAARAQFLHEQSWDRTLQRNRYSYGFLYNNYKNAVDELCRDHFYSINKDFNDYSFLEDLYKLNNEYMGLGLGNMYMSSGMDYVSQNTLCSDYGRSLMSDLTGQNGTAATMAGIAASIPGPDQWTLASPADRLKIGRENGIYQSYTLVGAYKTKRQVGQRDNAENGETDDFITGYEFHYETDDGKQFKSYIDNNSDVSVFIWDKDGVGDVGHTAVRVGGLIFGYYPTDPDRNGYGTGELVLGPGEMHVDNIDMFKQIYRGDNGKIKVYNLNVTNNQSNKILINLASYVTNPGNYSLLGNNCTSVAYKSLVNAGVNINASIMLHNTRVQLPLSPAFFGNLLRGSNLVNSEFYFRW